MSDIKLDNLEIGDVAYTFVEGEFFKTESYARKLLGFADGIVEIKMIEVDGKQVPDFDMNLGAVLGNLAGKDFDAIRDFIFSTVRVVVDGKAIDFTDKESQSKHLAKHRSHYTQLLVRGLKLHFLDFLPSGEEFAKTMLGQAMNRAVAKIKA